MSTLRRLELQGPGANAALADALDAVPSSSSVTLGADQSSSAEAVWAHVKSTGKRRGAETLEVLAFWLVCNTRLKLELAKLILN